MRRLRDVIGRTEMLHQVSRGAEWLDDLDLNPLLVQADAGGNERYCTLAGRNEVPETLDAQMIVRRGTLVRAWREDAARLQHPQHAPGNRHEALVPHHPPVRDGEAATGAHHRAAAGLGGGSPWARLRCRASSSKCWGRRTTTSARALSGATIVVRTAPSSALLSQHNTIIGNTCLYGATAGKLFAAGQAGERFAVRNSGADTVIEGCGSNGCEYMTGGTVVILGAIGDNFGAGFTGGMAFIYDPDTMFEKRVNPDSLTWQRIDHPHWEGVLRDLVETHIQETNSRYAAGLLHDWPGTLANMWQVVPQGYAKYLPVPLSFGKEERRA